MFLQFSQIKGWLQYTSSVRNSKIRISLTCLYFASNARCFFNNKLKKKSHLIFLFSNIRKIISREMHFNAPFIDTFQEQNWIIFLVSPLPE